MSRLYLLKNDLLLGVIDSSMGDVIALPLLKAGDDMSLMSERHALALMSNLGLTAPQVLAAFNITDQRAALISTVFVAPQIVSLKTTVEGMAYKIVDIGAFSLWNVHSNAANLLKLHQELWAVTPKETLGLLAVVAVFGTSFTPSAARTATGMTAAQALVRRDKVAAYLESLGKTTTALRAATNENTQLTGILTALGVTPAQLWAKMVQ